MLHLRSAAQLVAIRLKKFSRTGNGGDVSPFQRISAESLLHNTAVNVLTSTDTDWILTQKIWDQVEESLEQLYSDDDDGPLSPLGIHPSLIRIVLETSCLARRSPLSTPDYIQALKVQYKLSVWLNRITSTGISPRDGSSPDDVLYHRATAMYAYACDILLLKTIDYDIQACHPHVQTRVQQMLDILYKVDTTIDYWNRLYCWPLLVLGLAMPPAHRPYLQKKLHSFWQRCYWGDGERIEAILDTAWASSRTGSTSPVEMRDNSSAVDVFGLLLRKKGLSGLIEIEN